MLFLNQIKESFLFALDSIVSNRLRTFLSLLGITIGIFAIISVFTVLDSIERNIRESIQSLGDNVVYVAKWPWEFSGEYKWWKYMNRPLPAIEELSEIMRRSDNVETGVFMISSSKPVQANDNTVEGATILGATHDYDKMKAFELVEGRYFSSFESQSGKNIAVIGNTVSKGLFGDKNPVGKTFRLMGYRVKVVGLFDKEGKDMITDMSLDEVVLVPVSFARKFIDIKSERSNPMIMLKAKDGVTALDLTEELEGIMRTIRRLKPKAEDNFALNRTSLLTQGFESLFSTIKVVSGIIGGFSILVGAFGIANIMFVSVKERTRQIGIQKALGAKNYYILLQFLYESVILSLFGGILGLFLIFIGSLLVERLFEMNMALTMGNIITGISISVIAGILAGIIPSSMASRLSPVDAMNSTF